MTHKLHGKGAEANGSDDSDCNCRGTGREADCAAEGCGFCKAALEKRRKISPFLFEDVKLSPLQQFELITFPARKDSNPDLSDDEFDDEPIYDERTGNVYRNQADADVGNTRDKLDVSDADLTQWEQSFTGTADRGSVLTRHIHQQNGSWLVTYPMRLHS